MNKTHFCFLLFFSFLISISCAQNFHPDSLIQLVDNSSGTKKADALNELSREWVYYDYKNILKTASEAFEISKKENYLKGEGEALVNLAVFYSISEEDSANLLFKEGINKIVLSGDSISLIYANVEMAVYDSENNSLSILQNANRFALSKADKNLEAHILSKFGTYYSNNRKFKGALMCFDQAISYYSQSGKTIRWIDCLIKKAETLLKMKSVIPSFKVSSFALNLAKKNKLPFSELQCERFLYTFYYNSGNFKNALATFVSITKILNAIRNYENEIIDKKKIKEWNNLKSEWADSIKKITNENEANYLKNQNENNVSTHKLKNVITTVTIIFFILIIIAIVLSWKSKQKIKHQTSIIKKLESELSTFKNESNPSAVIGPTGHDYNIQNSKENTVESEINKTEHSFIPAIKIPDNFFLVAGQNYFNNNSFIRVIKDADSNTDRVVFLSDVGKPILKDVHARLNSIFDTKNIDILSGFLSEFADEVASFSSVEGGAFSLNKNSLLCSISAVGTYLFIIREAGKKGLKINGKQQLPKKFNEQASLYEFKLQTGKPFSIIKDVQLEKGDKIYFISQSTYEVVNQKGTTIDSLLMKISTSALYEQELAISKVKSLIGESSSFIFIGGSAD